MCYLIAHVHVDSCELYLETSLLKEREREREREREGERERGTHKDKPSYDEGIQFFHKPYRSQEVITDQSETVCMLGDSCGVF
jgi:hypothetical protein